MFLKLERKLYIKNNNSMVFKWVLYNDFHLMSLQDLKIKIGKTKKKMC